MPVPPAPTVKTRRPRLPAAATTAIRMRAIRRDHGGAVRRDDALEQDQLGGEIRVLGRVIVHVIARQIGEAADRHTHAVDAMLVEAVRGGLHREMRDAVLGETRRACAQVRSDRAS